MTSICRYKLTSSIIFGLTVLISSYSVSIWASSTDEQVIVEQNKQQNNGGIIANLMVEHDTPFMLYPYDTNYLLVSYTSNMNKEPIATYEWASHAQKVENKFQISLAFPIWRGIFTENSLLGASYTQRSWWQAYNHKDSSPFRDTNYEPQLFLAWLTDWQFAGWTIQEVEFGLNHQSNGRSENTSRSWNRGYMRISAVNGNWLIDIKPWFRFNESRQNDDNPDMIKYMGHYRAKIGYKAGESIFSIDGHYNWRSGYGGVEAGWSYPLTKHVRFYSQVFSGYGESMIDYNQKQDIRVGAGFMLNDLF